MRLLEPGLVVEEQIWPGVLFKIPGRVRYNLAALKSFMGEKAVPHLEHALSHFEGVSQIKANAFTGDVLVIYDPETLSEPEIRAELRWLLEEAGGIEALSQKPLEEHDHDHHSPDQPHEGHDHDHSHDDLSSYTGRLWLGGGALGAILLKRLIWGASPFALSRRVGSLGRSLRLLLACLSSRVVCVPWRNQPSLTLIRLLASQLWLQSCSEKT